LNLEKKDDTEPNLEPHNRYLKLNGTAYDIVSKRQHSKAWHDERERCVRNGKSKKVANIMAKKVAKAVMKKWEAQVDQS